MKIGNYDSKFDDSITLQCDIFIIDNVISNNNSQFQFYSAVNFNSINVVTPATQSVLKLSRSGQETPNLILNGQILSATSNLITIKFDLSHSFSSTGEAYFSYVAFYLPNYLQYQNNLTPCVQNTVNDSAVFFSVNFYLIKSIINRFFNLKFFYL